MPRARRRPGQLAASWTGPVRWAVLGVLSAFAAGLLYFHGSFSGGLFIDVTCARLGQPFDGTHLASHPEQWFPLRRPCNAHYDLVPAWLNPTLVTLALCSVTCATMALVPAVQRSHRA